MAWLQSTYTIRLNHRHQLFGHVFSGRYKAQLVEGSGNGYLRTACDYVHLNPVRARMLKAEERLLAYPWSSFGAYLAAPEHRPTWVRVDRLLGEHGIQEDTPAGRAEFERGWKGGGWRRRDPEALKALRRGWCLGSESFRREMCCGWRASLGSITRGIAPGQCRGQGGADHCRGTAAAGLAGSGFARSGARMTPVKLEIGGAAAARNDTLDQSDCRAGASG